MSNEWRMLVLESPVGAIEWLFQDIYYCEVDLVLNLFLLFRTFNWKFFTGTSNIQLDPSTEPTETFCNPFYGTFFDWSLSRNVKLKSIRNLWLEPSGTYFWFGLLFWSVIFLFGLLFGAFSWKLSIGTLIWNLWQEPFVGSLFGTLKLSLNLELQHFSWTFVWKRFLYPLIIGIFILNLLSKLHLDLLLELSFENLCLELCVGT